MIVNTTQTMRILAFLAISGTLIVFTVTPTQEDRLVGCDATEALRLVQPSGGSSPYLLPGDTYLLFEVVVGLSNLQLSWHTYSMRL